MFGREHLPMRDLLLALRFASEWPTKNHEATVGFREVVLLLLIGGGLGLGLLLVLALLVLLVNHFLNKPQSLSACLTG